ncbi:MAG: protein kinase domain-containing protein [Bryobacteraceae bacterium]
MASVVESGWEVTPGTRLGPYELLSPLGEGGMGEVWKARDTRLDRVVALKVSKAEFTERFEREARAVAALNHTHNCQLYDVGPNYLVMELVDGSPLKGPLAVEKAVEYAGQILDALDAAHRKGIIHRDLKPGNILVTKQGIKLLDFGLAKQETPLQRTDSTLTKALTGEGQILGTLHYISPEQLQAKPADARSDIFAFGCVLYEILSGKRAFEGASTASVIAAILEREPAALQVSPPLDRVIRTCLAKDPDNRFQTALDLKRNLSWAMEQQPPSAAKPKRWLWPVAAALVAVGALVGWAVSRSSPTRVSEQVVRFPLLPPEGGQMDPSRGVAVSPNGRMLAYIASVQGKSGLWVRPLDGTVARRLPGTEDARRPFWSPDSRSIAFSSIVKLLRIDVAGGTAVTICETSAFNGTWSPDGVIVAAQVFGGLMRVPAAGGTPTPLTTLDLSRGDLSHTQPRILPGGRILFRVRSAKPENSGIYVTSLANPKEIVRLASASGSMYAAGHLLWLSGTSLMAQRFDPDRLQLSGEPTPVTDPVGITEFGTLNAAAGGGILLYANQSGNEAQLTWFDPAGNAPGTLGQPTTLGPFRLSPDGRRVVTSRQSDGVSGLWIMDVQRAAWNRFSFMAAMALPPQFPIWSADGRQVLFRAGAPPNLYQKDADGGGTERRITESPNTQWPTDWSRDGRLVLYYELAPDTQRDLWVMPVAPDGKLEPAKARLYLRTRFNELSGRFSPDPNPRWVAYQSDESGRNEIYVQAFPEARGKWQISTGGGQFPEWSPDGKELYYLAPDSKLMAVIVKLGAESVQPSVPRELFAIPADGTVSQPYAVAPDGKRFLVRAAVSQRSQPLEVIVNWPALLKK